LAAVTLKSASPMGRTPCAWLFGRPPAAPARPQPPLLTVDAVNAPRIRAGFGGLTRECADVHSATRKVLSDPNAYQKAISATDRRQIAPFRLRRERHRRRLPDKRGGPPRAAARAASQGWWIHDGKDRGCPV